MSDATTTSGARQGWESTPCSAQRIHDMQCALREIHIWAKYDGIYDQPREEVMRQISDKCFAALYLNQNASAMASADTQTP
jgi:hypothetical protein